MKKSFLYLLFFVIFSCNSEEETSFIASYKDNNLTLEEVLLNKPLSIDSATFMNKYIERWIKDQIMLDKAQLYIDENDKDLQLKVKKYKELLIINRYQSELINNKFDTTVLRSEIEEYYTNYQQDNQINGQDLPLSFEIKEIRERIRYEKRLNFLKKIEQELYNEAQASEYIRIYK